MCGSSPKAPATPDVVPEAAVAPEVPTEATGSTQASQDARRRAAASGQNNSTILTGSRGTTASGSTAGKTLLGQ